MFSDRCSGSDMIAVVVVLVVAVLVLVYNGSIPLALLVVLIFYLRK